MDRPLTLRADVSLDPVRPEHAADMLAWMQDPVVSRNLGLRGQPSMARTLAWIQSAADGRETRAFAILSGTGHVGNVVLDRMDDYLGTARLSVYVGRTDSRGAGAGRTGIFRALHVAFGELGLHKVWLTVHCANYRAVNTYTRLGFRIEGVLRDEFMLDGERVDAFYMGLLAEEFRARAARAEEVLPE